MNNCLKNRLAKKHEYGLSLVELMVALVIGMLVTLVISQTLSVYEGQKRTTSGTADAQTNGSLALYALQRETEMAGYAVPNITFTDSFSTSTTNPNFSPFVCSSVTNYTENPSNKPYAVNIFPVSITSGVNNDSITIRYGTSSSGGIPTSLLADFTGDTASVDTPVGCNPGDSVLIIPSASTNCLITRIPTTTENKNIDPVVSNTITLATKYNPPIITKPAKLSCLGTWNEVSFSIDSNKLMRNADPVGNNIIAMKAQYGISASANDNKVTEWVDAKSSWAAPSVDDRKKIKSIRVALLAINNLYERDAVTNNNPTYFGGLQFTLAGIDNWQHYRYRVFETIIPLRNVAWSREAIQ